MGGFFLGFIGGVFAWIVTALVGQPIYHFISLRAEAARVLARYERSDAGPAPEATDANWIAERKRAYQECGARLVAFAAANHRDTPPAQSLLGTVSLLSEIGWRGTDYARRFGPGRKYAHSHARSSCFASQTRSWIVGEELTLGNSPRSRNALSGLRARYARSALILS